MDQAYFANLADQRAQKGHEIIVVGVPGKAIEFHHIYPFVPRSA
jgi:hypothetical protein